MDNRKKLHIQHELFQFSLSFSCYHYHHHHQYHGDLRIHIASVEIRLTHLVLISSWHGHTHYICSFSSQHLLVVIIILIIITINFTEICIIAGTCIDITNYLVSSHHHLVLSNIISIIITAKHHCHCHFCTYA